ncbi:hypothetical protein V498_05395 [Pseudogymnoascus sp. VKM F-4517 (FW-2822)]|nr:hypothetical protein V498_05395 [Pseudogymnoascus sp. VKM F-4517 (FW-2822)]
MFSKLFSTSSHAIEYRPLEKPTSIRIVMLQKGSRRDTIKCSIVHTELNEIPYQALSYEWGLPNNDRTIRIDGCRVRIRRNLYEALVQIRSTTDTMVLWIDAFCINQADIPERNQQVTMMGKIYKGAKNVIVWIGVAWDNSDIAMEKLADDRFRDLVRSESLGMVEKEAIIALCNRSYWRRAWIIQELFLARSYVLWCGSKFISEEKLGTSLATMNRYGESDADQFRKAIRKSPADNHRSSKEFRGTSLNTMGRWLRMSVEIKFKSAEPHDLIYAVLAVSPISNNGQIIVDYAKPLRDVYLETLTVYYAQSKTREEFGSFARRLAAHLGLVTNEELERCISNIVRFETLTSAADDSMEQID